MDKKRKEFQQPLLYIAQGLLEKIPNEIQSEFRIYKKKKSCLKAEIEETKLRIAETEFDKEANEVNEVDECKYLDKTFVDSEQKAIDVQDLLENKHDEVMPDVEIEISEDYINEKKTAVQIRKEMESSTFDLLDIAEKIDYLMTLPKYIGRVLVALRTQEKSYIGRIYSYQQDKGAIFFLNNNNLKMFEIKLDDIESLSVIGF